MSFRPGFLALVMLGCSGSLGPEGYLGTWGGEGVRFTVSTTTARFETPCWSGDLAVVVDLDDHELTAAGALNWQGGAGGTESRTVVLNGQRHDRVLVLTVESSMSLGPYMLRRGQAANIPGCP